MAKKAKKTAKPKKPVKDTQTIRRRGKVGGLRGAGLAGGGRKYASRPSRYNREGKKRGSKANVRGVSGALYDSKGKRTTAAAAERKHRSRNAVTHAVRPHPGSQQWERLTIRTTGNKRRGYRTSMKISLHDTRGGAAGFHG